MPGYGQSLGAALGQLAFGGGDPMNTKSGMQGMLDGAHAGAYDANRQQSLAQALKASAEAEQVTMQNRSRDPGAVLRNAMTNYGIPQDSTGAVEGFLKTGELGGGYQNSADGYGPSMPAPAWADKLPDLGRSVAGVNTALSVGEKNVENMAKADSIARDSRMKDGVMAGKVDPLLLAKAEYAGKGSAPFNFNEYGTGNNLTGTLDETTGAARNFADKRKSETQENKAQAGSANASAANSYASAGQHKASMDKIRQEITQGGKSGQTQIITDAAGNVTLVDKVTGQARPATYADGQTVGAKVGGKSDKPLTEGQAKAVAFASRMENSISIVDNLAAGGVNKSIPGSRAGYGVGSAINMMQPEARQQLDQAKRDFINANLRRESGAVISDPEFSNAELQYFPQPGDGPKVIAQKATNRKIALEGMKADIPANMGDATGNIIRKASGAPASNIDALLNKYK